MSGPGQKLEMINRAAGKGDGIEDDNPRGAEGLGQRGIILARHQDAAHQQSKTGQKTHGGAQFGRDEVVVKRVFDKERDAQEQGQAARPGKQLDAHELFPIDRGSRFGEGADRFGFDGADVRRGRGRSRICGWWRRNQGRGRRDRSGRLRFNLRNWRRGGCSSRRLLQNILDDR